MPDEISDESEIGADFYVSTRAFPVARARLFRAWTDPQQLAVWLASRSRAARHLKQCSGCLPILRGHF